MKYIFYALITACVLFSCKNKQTSTTKDSAAKSVSISKTEDNLIERFKPIIQGVWVNKDYIEKVAKTKSADSAGTVSFLVISIETSKIAGDSLKWEAADNHEGNEGVLYFRKGKRANTIMFNEYYNSHDLGYLVDGRDTTLLLYINRDGKESIEKFTKVFNRISKDGYYTDGAYLAVNKVLIAGKYNYADSAGTNKPVTFYADGKVDGMQNFKRYIVNMDLNVEPMDNLDGISFFGKDRSIFKFLPYKIQNDTLSFYDSHPNADSTERILGKRLYKLVRQHNSTTQSTR